MTQKPSGPQTGGKILHQVVLDAEVQKRMHNKEAGAYRRRKQRPRWRLFFKTDSKWRYQNDFYITVVDPPVGLGGPLMGPPTPYYATDISLSLANFLVSRNFLELFPQRGFEHRIVAVAGKDMVCSGLVMAMLGAKVSFLCPPDEVESVRTNVRVFQKETLDYTGLRSDVVQVQEVRESQHGEDGEDDDDDDDGLSSMPITELSVDSGASKKLLAGAGAVAVAGAGTGAGRGRGACPWSSEQLCRNMGAEPHLDFALLSATGEPFADDAPAMDMRRQSLGFKRRQVRLSEIERRALAPHGRLARNLERICPDNSSTKVVLVFQQEGKEEDRFPILGMGEEEEEHEPSAADVVGKFLEQVGFDVWPLCSLAGGRLRLLWVERSQRDHPLPFLPRTPTGGLAGAKAGQTGKMRRFLPPMGASSPRCGCGGYPLQNFLNHRVLNMEWHKSNDQLKAALIKHNQGQKTAHDEIKEEFQAYSEAKAAFLRQGAREKKSLQALLQKQSELEGEIEGYVSVGYRYNEAPALSGYGFSAMARSGDAVGGGKASSSKNTLSEMPSSTPGQSPRGGPGQPQSRRSVSGPNRAGGGSSRSSRLNALASGGIAGARPERPKTVPQGSSLMQPSSFTQRSSRTSHGAFFNSAMLPSSSPSSRGEGTSIADRHENPPFWYACERVCYGLGDSTPRAQLPPKSDQHR